MSISLSPLPTTTQLTNGEGIITASYQAWFASIQRFLNSGSATGITGVLGTTGEIDVSTVAGVATVSIDGAYVGQTSITTLGTIATGTWHGTAIAVAYGGVPSTSGITNGWVLTNNSGTPAWEAAGGGSGTVTSVALADGSTAPIYTISGSPVTTSGTLEFTLNTQTENYVFAGPTTGSAAQPTFRALVAADLPSGTTPTGANPSASVGLSVVNGSAATFLRSDGAPALSQSISPTWTGNHTFSATGVPVAITPSNNKGLTIAGAANQFCAILTGNSTSTESYGLRVNAGTTSADVALLVDNQAASTTYLEVYGDGGIVAGSATGGDEGLGTINVSSNYYINGTPIGGPGFGSVIKIINQTAGSSPTYTIPSAANFVRVYLIGGGGGGGGGSCGVGTQIGYGGGGGASGNISVIDLLGVDVAGTTLTVAFSNASTGGAGGGGASRPGSGITGGTGGTAGSAVTLETGGGQILLTAGGGGGGVGGDNPNGAGGSVTNKGNFFYGIAGGTGGSTGSGTGPANLAAAGTSFAATFYGPTSGGGGGGCSAIGATFAGTAGGSGNAAGMVSVTGGSPGAGAVSTSTNGSMGSQGTYYTSLAGAGGGGGGSGGGGTGGGGNGAAGAGFGSGGGGGGGAGDTSGGTPTGGTGGAGGYAAAIILAW